MTKKNSRLIQTLIIIIVIMYMVTLQHVTTYRSFKRLEHKLDSVLTMQKEIYKLDSAYLQATRIHMGQCAFELKEEISADINN